jgi:aminoglycoside 3-N-acetyltransferase
MGSGMIHEITGQTIEAGLRQLGLSAGDQVMVHSSLKSLGKVVGGPETVIRALMAVLTPEGTLMMPAFNHGKVYEPGGPGIFDLRSSPTTNGAIPQTFWQMDNVYRSLSPTHSFAAWGKHALAYVQGHHRTWTCGPDSPLGRLAQAGGYGLLIGVDYRSNTFHHVVESLLGSPCLGQRTIALPMRLPDGRVVEGRTWTWRSRSCPITDAAVYGAEIERRGLERRMTIGQGVVRCFRLLDSATVIAECLTRGVGDLPPCRTCSVRPEHDARNVPSDWDESTGSLKPGSPAQSF